MPDKARPTSHRCPECGAPINFQSAPAEQWQVRCDYCGAYIPIPGRKAAASPVPRPPVVSGDGRLVKSGWGCSTRVWLVLFVVLPLLVFAAVTYDRASVTHWLRVSVQPPLRPVSAPIALGGDDRAAVQLIMAAYEETGSRLIGFDPSARREVWRSLRLSDRWYEMAITADATTIYVADGAELLAFARSDGALVWRTTLANNVQTTCATHAPCLHHLAGVDVEDATLAVLARDGTVQAFAAATGAPRWSRRLNTTPRQLLSTDDAVIVIDGDERNRAIVLALDAQRGEPRFELRPTCRTNDFNYGPSPHDRYLLTPDRRSLIVASSGHAGCAWRYDLADGAETWRYVPDAASGARPAGVLPFTWVNASSLLVDSTLYVVNDQGRTTYLYRLDTAQADAPHLVASVDQYDLTLEMSLGSRLLLSARPDYARNEVELWAIDPDSGDRVWQRAALGRHPFDEWAAQLTNQGLFLAACRWEASDCRFDLLDPATGVVRQSVQTPVGRSYGGETWLGATGYFVVGGKLHAVDLNAGRVLYSWP